MNNDKNKTVCCLCCKLNVTSAAILVSILCIVGVVLTIPSMFHHSTPQYYKITLVVTNTAWGITALLAAIAVTVDFYHLLVPYLVMLITGLTVLATSSVASFVLVFVSAFLPGSGIGAPSQFASMFLVANIGFALNFWFLYVVLRCYRYMKDRSEHFSENAPIGEIC